MSEELIFGHSWYDIKAMQQGEHPVRFVSKDREAYPDGIEVDQKILEQNGEQWLIDQGFHGTIDRLQRAGLLHKKGSQ